MLHHDKDTVSYMNESVSSRRRRRRKGCHVFPILSGGFLFHIDTDRAGTVDYADELIKGRLLTNNAKVLFS